MLDTVDRLTQPQTVLVISIAYRIAAGNRTDKTSAFFPGEAIVFAVVIAQRIAAAIISNGLPVECGQLVTL